MMEFKHPPSRSLYCPICHDLFREPLVSTVCGHSFCSPCIHQSLERDESCPICRHSLKETYLTLNLTLANVVQELPVLCPFRAQGCDKDLTWEQYDQHLQNCPFIPTDCSSAFLGCPFKGTREQLEKHECSYAGFKPIYLKLLERIKDLEEQLKALTEAVATNPEPRPEPKNEVIEHPSIIGLSEDTVLECKKTLEGNSGVTALAITQDFLLVGCHDGYLKVYRLSDYMMVSLVKKHTLTIWSIVVQGLRVYTAGRDGNIEVWYFHPENLELSNTTTLRNSSKVYNLLLCENVLFAACSDHKVRRWSTDEQFEQYSSLSETSCVNSFICFNPVDWLFLSALQDGSVKLWKVDGNYQPELVKIVLQLESPVLDLVVLPMETTTCSAQLVTSIQEPAIIVHEIGQDYSIICSRRLSSGHGWECWRLLRVQDDLYSAGFDHQICRWNTQNWACVQVLSGHRGYVHALAWCDRAGLLISACADRTVKFWG